ncbi:conserved hypothetical protein [Talaromyces marneffei ATCC 18224]|uniref:Aminotransferase class I/classII domain-containing protein n=1 Tax=Talaromyces marneffei (strain ATCC 18224 / CBS 334.59 / QM 7333) TaxID=441960 RepID=B6QMQ9_TALMQ|nr:conserved hypothetical protein [Talaromyces marneffei ATCC 18224]
MAIEATVPQPHINLQRGWPSPHLLPAKALLAGADGVLSNTARATDVMLYGPNIGDPALRKDIAEWLSRLYCLRSPQAQIQKLRSRSQLPRSALLSGFTDPVYARRIWMVEPTYFLACTIFEDAGFQGRLTGVPEGDDGVDVEFLRARINDVDEEAAKSGADAQETTFKNSPQYPKLYRHVITSFPRSAIQARKHTHSRGERLWLNWLGSGFTGHSKSASMPPPPPPRLIDVDNSLPGGDLKWGNAVSNGSFSKVLGPGMRCGWAEATPDFITRLNLVLQVNSRRPLIEHVLRTGNMEDHIRQVLVPTYKARCAIVQQAIEEYLGPLGGNIDIGRPYNLPAGNETEQVMGGFINITFPEGIAADDVAAVSLKDYNLRFLASGAMRVRGSSGMSNEALLSRGARLCWAWEEEYMLIEGVKRIASVLKEKFLVS